MIPHALSICPLSTSGACSSPARNITFYGCISLCPSPKIHVPTYEYRCLDGHEFEHFVQKISLAASELPCPICGKLATRKISAGGGFLFKGSGFYITDYGKDGKKDQRDKAEKAASSKALAATNSEAGQGDVTAKRDASGTATATSARTESGVKTDPSEKVGTSAKGDKGKAATPSVVAPTSPKKEGGKD